MPRKLTWIFEPLVAVRPDMTGEAVFTERFQKLMGGARQRPQVWFIDNEPETFPLLQILDPLTRYPTAHDTQVVSTLMRWIGTHIGGSFLSDAEKFADEMKSLRRPEAFHAAWALANRVGQVDELARNKAMGMRVTRLRDCKLLELAAAWLGTKEGQAYIRGARREIEIKNQRESAEFRRKHGLGAALKA